MAKEILTVRDVDEEVWKRFRAMTEEEGMKTGQALSQALDYWVNEKARRRVPDPRRFLRVGGIVKVNGRVSWSQEADKILYGEGT